MGAARIVQLNESILTWMIRRQKDFVVLDEKTSNWIAMELKGRDIVKDLAIHLRTPQEKRNRLTGRYHRIFLTSAGDAWSKQNWNMPITHKNWNNHFQVESNIYITMYNGVRKISSSLIKLPLPIPSYLLSCQLFIFLKIELKEIILERIGKRMVTKCSLNLFSCCY